MATVLLHLFQRSNTDFSLLGNNDMLPIAEGSKNLIITVINNRFSQGGATILHYSTAGTMLGEYQIQQVIGLKKGEQFNLT